jgi:hypothetical protein
LATLSPLAEISEIIREEQLESVCHDPLVMALSQPPAEPQSLGSVSA